MCTRFEGDIKRRSSRLLTCLFKGDYFSVWATEDGVITFADNLAIANDNCTNHWIWGRMTPAALGQLERAAHERNIRFVLSRALVRCHSER